MKSGTGVGQMGATVLLYNRYDQLVRQALTNEQGKFVFDALGPDLYSIRVTLASFVPAFRRNIAVAAGSESVLQINLANLLSSVDLVSTGAPRGTLMSDDWKWVLRTSQATRPVLRILPNKPSSSSSQSTATMFSDTTGLVRVSAGDGNSFATGSQPDLGTAFSLATSIYGSGRVQFSGNLGYAASTGLPTGAFRASYSKTGTVSGPQVTLTVRQLYLPNRAGGDSETGTDGTPALRTASLAVLDAIDLTDALRVEYGASLESISFLQRLNYMSPFARMTYKLDQKNSFRIGYSDGTDPSEMMARGAEQAQSDLNQNLAVLSRMPRISRSDSQARMQRTQNFEVAFHRVQGSRTFSATVYHESVSNAALMLSGDANFVPISDSIADLGSQSQIFNIGNYRDFGYAAAFNQSFGTHLEASVSAGRGTSLASTGREAATNDANEVRGLIRPVQRPWVTMRIAGTVPVSGTHLTADYGWTDLNAVTPAHFFLTEESGSQFGQETGLNVRMRQPLPVFSGLPGRLEFTIEMRNMLAQGYLPLNADGRRALLTNSPRAVRGGFSFIF